MAFVHRQSCEGVKSELDLFAVPPTQTSIDQGGWIEHQPITSLDSGGPIEFVVPGAGDAYIDLANTYLLVRAKVIRGAGTDIADDTPVAPVNNWLHSLFSQVDVHLNDTLVTPSSNTYPFRAYVETLLSYGAEAKKTQLTSQLWYKDTAGHMEATQENAGNAGPVERHRHIAGSRVVEMMGRLHVDLFMQDRFLIFLLCKEEDVGYVDLWDSFVGKEEMYLRDGLHLSGKGAAVFAEGLSGTVASGLGKVRYLN